MHEVSVRLQRRFVTHGSHDARSFSVGNKMTTVAPPERSFWHSHNMTAVLAWLDWAESQRLRSDRH